MKRDYKIDELLRLFSDHSLEFEKFEEDIDNGVETFNLPNALKVFCKEIIDLRNEIIDIRKEILYD